MMQDTRIIIIGAGPAGVFAAIRAAEENPEARITVLESGEEPLKKVLLSGGGRCNLTHEPSVDVNDFAANYPRGFRELRGPLSHFGAQETIEWFQNRGVRLKTEQDGRVFPETNKAKTIADCLLTALNDSGATIKTRTEVSHIKPTNTGFVVNIKGGGHFSCDKLLIAGGGNRRAMELALSMGHSLEEPVPALFGLKSRAPEIDSLAGTGVGEATLLIDGTKFPSSGPLLITHTGLSGPAVLKLSSMSARFLAEHDYRATLKINWLGSVKQATALETLQKTRKTDAAKQIFNAYPFKTVPSRLFQRLAFTAGIRKDTRWATVTAEHLQTLSLLLTATKIQISGKDPKGQEFVTCGGIRLKEIDLRTMESKIVKGLFLAGEVMDIDGFTGGFNLQNAWTSGYIAGTALAR